MLQFWEKKEEKDQYITDLLLFKSKYFYRLDRARQDWKFFGARNLLRQELTTQICARRLDQFFGYERNINCRSFAVRKQIFFS